MNKGVMMKTKRVMFSRPIQIGDIDYEVDVPDNLEHEDEIQEWIMNNLDKVEQTSFCPDSYYLGQKLSAKDPSNWDSWSVEICPAINFIHHDEEELTFINGDNDEL